ncbi:alkaline-phosphatase-like protein [Aspergillus falconensis]
MKFTLPFLWSIRTAAKPNNLFILTDDQGKYMGGLDHMSRLQVIKGTMCSKHFTNIWIGRMPANTNVTDVSLPYGGCPKGSGFNRSEFLSEPYTYRYYNAKMTRNRAEPVDYSGQYVTDVLSDKAIGFLNGSLKNPDRPWMLTVAPNAPHSNGSATADGTHWFGEPESAPRHANLFKDYKIPRDKSCNRVIEGAIGWVKDISQLSQKEVDYIDEFQRCQTDINVPLIVRGPGISKGTVDSATSHSDLAPMFLSLTNAPNREVQAVPEGIYGYISNQTDQADNAYEGNTYKGLRLVLDDCSLYYSVWCNKKREFYNLKDDPYQTVNMAANTSQDESYRIVSRPLSQIFQRANALIVQLGESGALLQFAF